MCSNTTTQGALRRSWRACVRTAAPVFASVWVFGFVEVAEVGSASPLQLAPHSVKSLGFWLKSRDPQSDSRSLVGVARFADAPAFAIRAPRIGGFVLLIAHPPPLASLPSALFTSKVLLALRSRGSGSSFPSPPLLGVIHANDWCKFQQGFPAVGGTSGAPCARGEFRLSLVVFARGEAPTRPRRRPHKNIILRKSPPVLFS